MCYDSLHREEDAMAWIEMIPEDEAQGELKALYDRMVEPWGGVDNIMKIHSLNPPSLRGHYELYATLMRGRSDLTRVQREMIAVVVSALNRCRY
jgi:alkylhydroperoxidase family enzyme